MAVGSTKRRALVFYDDVSPCDGAVLVLVRSVGELSAMRKELEHSKEFEAFIAARLRKPEEWLCFFCVVDGAIIAFSSLHVPGRTRWLDSLPTRANTARESGTYVEPAWRRLGLRRRLLCEQVAWCEAASRQMWAVIEYENLASLRSSIGAGGAVVRENVLVKIGDRNVLSIVDNPRRVYVVPKLLERLRW